MPNLNIKLNDKAWKVLEELAKKNGKSKAEVLRNALTLIYIAEEEKEKDHYLAVVDNKTDELMVKLVNIL